MGITKIEYNDENKKIWVDDGWYTKDELKRLVRMAQALEDENHGVFQPSITSSPTTPIIEPGGVVCVYGIPAPRYEGITVRYGIPVVKGAGE